MVKVLLFPGRFTLWLSLTLLTLTFLTGCDKPASRPDAKAKPAEAKSADSGTTNTPEVAAAAPGKDEKTCFECKGQGTVKCQGNGCMGGKAECPGPCMKLTKGTWVKMNVAGHDPNELWQKFRGKKTGGAWSQAHVGEVISLETGEPVNIGPCKVCGGSTKVQCSACKGSGRQTCNICSGKKFIPAAWTDTDNPWFNSQPDLIRLRDGRVLLAKVAANTGDESILRLRDGKTLRVKKQDIVTSPTTNSATSGTK